MVKEELKREEIDDKYKWDLSALIKSEKEFDRLFSFINKSLKELKKCKDKILDNDKTLLEFLILNEKTETALFKIYSYASLKNDEDTKNPKYQSLKIKVENLDKKVNEELSFAVPEIIRGGYALVKKYVASNKDLKVYKFYFKDLFRSASHILGEKEEELISQAVSAFKTGEDVFENLNNTDIKLGIIKDENGNEVRLTSSNYIKFVQSKNMNVRKSAFKTLYEYYKSFNNSFASSLRGNIKENIFLSKVRKFSSPLEASLFSDNINTKVYKNLINEVHENLETLYKYLNLKSKLLNLKEMHMYDIYLNPIKIKNEDISYEESKDLLFNALKPLGENYLNILNKSFEEKWIDVLPNDGKRSGAYCNGYCHDVHPYVLINFDNTIDSTSTMVHELGHAIHSYLSNENQPFIYHNYPIFLAEIASTVNEMILNNYLYKTSENKNDKIYHLINLLDQIRTTIFRQTMFAEFESIIHDRFKEGISLTASEFNEIYYNLNKLYYGKKIISDEEIKYEWSRVPHFYSSFYVYKYATGLSCALEVSKNIIDEKEGYKENYIKFLSSGGSNYPLEILKKLNIDLESGKVISNALELFKEKVNELEKLIQE